MRAASGKERADNPVKERKSIVFASDARGIVPLSVAVWSLLEQAEEGTVYQVNVLSDGIPETAQDAIRQLAERQGKRHILRFFELEKVIPRDLGVTETIPRATWARLFLGRILPDVDRALYLDIDTMCCTDLSALCETDMKGAVVAGVLEEESHPASSFNKRLGIPLSCPGYINAGVMLMDLARFRDENLDAMCLEFYEEHRDASWALDQDSINGALYSRILPIHPRWNWNDSWTRRLGFVRKNEKMRKGYPLEDCVQAALDPGILHFMGRYKPWFYNYRLEGKRYAECMARAGLLGENGLPGFTFGKLVKKMTHALLYAHAHWRVRRLAKRLREEGSTKC